MGQVHPSNLTATARFATSTESGGGCYPGGALSERAALAAHKDGPFDAALVSGTDSGRALNILTDKH